MGGVWILGCAAGAAAAAWLCLQIWNRSPDRWFCDYGEQPGGPAAVNHFPIWPNGAAFFALLFVFFAAFRLQYGNTPLFYTSCAAAVFLLLISAADFKYQIIPDQYVVALLLAGAAAAAFSLSGAQGAPFRTWGSPLLGSACGAGLMLLMALAGRLLYRKEALGFGDVKLFAAAGLFAGFPNVFSLFLLAILLAFFAVVFLFLRKKLTGGSYFPLGPFICLALLLFLAFYSQIMGFLAWYFSLLNL